RRAFVIHSDNRNLSLADYFGHRCCDSLGQELLRARKDRLTGGGEVGAAVPQRNANRSNPERFARHRGRSYHFPIAVSKAKEAESNRVKYWEIIARNL